MPDFDSAGTGHNGALHWAQDVETVTVNVLGFMAKTKRYALVAFVLKLLTRPG